MRRTPELRPESLRAVLAWKSPNVDVYPTADGAWRVEKDGVELIVKNDKHQKRWKSLNLCVATLTKWGASKITIHTEGLNA